MTSDQADYTARRLDELIRRLGLSLHSFMNEQARLRNVPATDTHAMGVLLAAARNGRRLTAGDISYQLGLSAAATTSLIQRLNQRGWVSVRRDPEDARHVSISPRAKMRTRSSTEFSPLLDAYRRVYSDYQPAQLELLADLLDKLAIATEEARNEL